MKYILFFILLLGSTASAQLTYYIRSDSVKIEKTGGSNELFIKNATRGVNGVLTNVGGGKTQFIASRKVGDTLFIGKDTLLGFSQIANNDSLFGKTGGDNLASENRTFNLTGSYNFELTGSDASNYLRFRPANSNQFAHQSLSGVQYSSITADAFNGFFVQVDRTDQGGSGGLFSATYDQTYVELAYPSAGFLAQGTTGLLNQAAASSTVPAYSLLADSKSGAPFTGIYLSKHHGIRIGTGGAVNSLNLRGLRVDSSRAIFMDSLENLTTQDQLLGIVNSTGQIGQVTIGPNLSFSGGVLSATGGGVTDHGALTGLADDDHTQYALLAGRSGGQSLIGGTGVTDALTLQSTSGVGTTDHIKFLVGNNGATESMRINNNGKIGVGIAGTPLSLLTLPDDSYPTKLLGFGNTANSAYITLEASKGIVLINAVNGISGFFKSDAQKVFTYNDNGNVLFGAGTIGSTHNFDFNGTSLFQGQTQHELQLKIKDISAPSTPSSGYGALYVNTDRPVFKDDAGNVHDLSNRSRVGTTASSATPTPDADANDVYTVTALATNAVFAAPTGTPFNGQKLIIRVKDDGTSRTLGWNAIYRSGDIPLPTGTVISKTMYVGFVYNSADTKWDLVSYIDNF